jgi:hypothetical protein
MPVVGHGLMGWALAAAAEPLRPGRGRPSPWWLPVLVGLSYAPDIVTQALLLAGQRWGPSLGHSVPFVVLLGVVVAAPVARLLDVRFGRALALTLAALLLHVGVDLLQATDRRPLWPFTSWRCGPDEPILPTGLPGEAAVCGAPLLVLLPWRLRRVGGAARTRAVWGGAMAATIVVAAAAATHVLRDRREDAFERGARLVEEGRYDEALLALDESGRWPSTAKPGRIDYLRGEVLAGRGERDRAERRYLLSYETDPTYFWVVADLAAFYAAPPGDVATRRARAAPWVERLQRDFARHPALPDALARVDRALARP